ncbi:MAG: hypothetical protein M1819_001080 [Sarea resinae]|nr:MAG: hypothetical protein M1819_001080 [Sarea resinae]
MKVYHDSGPPPSFVRKDREYNIYVCEMKAYRRLKERGICEKGIVPQFYGSIEQIRPKLWQPNLDMFAEDKYLPSAILIEYIPDMRMLDLATYTPKRMEKFIDGLKAIHEALVLHQDAKPHNMMVVPGDPDRVLWIDFDRAETYDEDRITPEQREWIDHEARTVEELAVYLPLDCAEGRYNQTILWFF